MIHGSELAMQAYLRELAPAIVQEAHNAGFKVTLVHRPDALWFAFTDLLGSDLEGTAQVNGREVVQAHADPQESAEQFADYLTQQRSMYG